MAMSFRCNENGHRSGHSRIASALFGTDNIGNLANLNDLKALKASGDDPPGDRGSSLLSADLEGPTLVVLCVDPGSQGQLMDEHLGRLGEQQRRLSRDHLHILIQLHDLLDPGQWQLLLLKIILEW